MAIRSREERNENQLRGQEVDRIYSCRETGKHCQVDGEDARNVALVQEAQMGEEDEGRRQGQALILYQMLLFVVVYVCNNYNEDMFESRDAIFSFLPVYL